MSKNITIKIGDSKISQVLTEEIFNGLSNRVLFQANTGTGKTTFLSTLSGKKILATSRTNALKDVIKSYPNAGVFYGEDKNLSNSEFIITTHQSLVKLSHLVDISEYTLIVDESHNIVSSASTDFLNSTYNEIVDTFPFWGRVILTSATPIDSTHPNMKNFDTITIDSNIRQQNAVWVDAKNSVKFTLDTINLDEVSIIFINSKNEKGDLGLIKQGLLEKGFTEESIMIYNSLQRDSAEELISTNNIPEGVKVIITTSVIIEGFNINTKVDKMFILSMIHPLMIQQLASRTRNEAIGMIYLFAHNVSNTLEELDLKLSLRLKSLNAEFVELSNKRGVEFATNYLSEYLKINNITTFSFDDIANRYKINHLSVDFLNFEDSAKFLHSDLEMLELALGQFNWAITNEKAVSNMTKKERDTLLAKQVDSTNKVIEELIVEAQVDMFGQVTVGQELNNLKSIVSNSGFTVKRNLADKMIRLMDEYKATFEKASEIVKLVGISEGEFKKVLRKCDIQVMRNKPESASTALVHLIYKQLEVGKSYTSNELCRIANTINKSSFGKSMKVKDFTFRTIIEFMSDFTTITRKSKRVEGKVTNAYIVVNLNPLNI